MATTQRIVAVALVVGVFLVGGIWYRQQQQTTKNFYQQVKAPHFLDSTPVHGEIYAAQPINVTINFDFDLAEESTITVRSADGREWQEDVVTIEDAQTALQVPLKQGMSDGQYQVTYTACWPDISCHNGQFSFSIDSNKQSEYQDLRGQNEITIHMKDIAFQQSKNIISRGTKVRWVNDESVGHFVNTETHPEHTYFIPHNSREIRQGESFITTFDIRGSIITIVRRMCQRECWEVLSCQNIEDNFIYSKNKDPLPRGRGLCS